MQTNQAFQNIPIDTQFRCDFGGLWKKLSPAYAVCLARDSAFDMGQVQHFASNDTVERI